MEQSLGLFQIEYVEAFGEPAVDRSEQFASLLHLALVAPEAREAHCCAGSGAILIFTQTVRQQRRLLTRKGPTAEDKQ